MSGGAALLTVPRIATDERVVVACPHTTTQRARLIDAFRGRATPRFVASPDDVLETLRSRIDAVDVVILPATENSADVERVVRVIAEQWPRVPILAYCDSPARCATSIRTLTAAGVHQFLFAGMSDSGIVFRDVLAAARRGCAADWIMTRLAPHVPARLRRFVEAVLSNPERVTTVPALAAELGVHRKTLFNWCENARFVPPGELIAWARLALVGFHLERTGCTVETIALDLAYPSDTTLRNTIKRYTGRRAQEVRDGGGLDLVIDAFARRIAEQRAALHEE